MRLPDDALVELWSLFDSAAIRPEYVLPMLHLESGFDPTAQNALGYVGLAQDYSAYLTRKGIDPASYRAMSAAEQLHTVIGPRLATLAGYYGLPRSATRVYQGNFLPASLRTAWLLSSPIALRGSSTYEANKGLVGLELGALTVGDLAVAMARQTVHPEVQDAIARAYAMRPALHPDPSPAFGKDFGGDPWGPLLVIAATAAAALFGR